MFEAGLGGGGDGVTGRDSCANLLGRISASSCPSSCAFWSNASMKAAVEEAPPTSEVDVAERISTSKTSSLADSNSCLTCSMLAGDRFVEHFRDGGEKLCSRESISIFSSFSSSRSFNSRTSASSPRTRSSRDSVYPLGNARRLSLSLVLHSKPTLAHCVQHGRMPSQLGKSQRHIEHFVPLAMAHRIFLLLHRSHAWAILACALVPTLITFIGRIPGMLSTWCASSGGTEYYRKCSK